MKKDYSRGITVFTPTFNRKDTLLRLYDSLKKQGAENFEWLIVDDGSTDNSGELIKSFIDEKIINIIYIYQENRGKTFAFNVGVKNANYNLFFCVDSDDYIADDTIKKLNNINEGIFNDINVVGIMGYKKNIKSTRDTHLDIKEDLLFVSELYRKYHFKDELALVYKTEVLVKYPFPIIDGEKFMPEGYLYDQLDLVGKCYFLKEDIYFYEYLDTGYTNNSVELLKRNINGYILYSKNRLENSRLWQNKIRGAIQYNISNLVAKNGLHYMKNKYFLLLILTFIPSYIYYLKKYK